MVNPQHWCRALFDSIDTKDSRAFTSFLTSDAQFRYGSAAPVTGIAAIVEALDAFFASVASLSHRIVDIWDVSEHLICRGEVCYTRLDGSSVTAPFCNVLAIRDDKICQYDIYLDPTPLHAS